VTAITLGLAAGIVFAWLWLWVVPWAVHGQFFRAAASLMQWIFKADELEAFLSLYGSLLKATGRYVGRNLAGTVVAGLPLMALYLITPGLLNPGFFVAFTASMTIVFFWPRLWPARPAF
jgi:hypothetical protein